MLITDGIQRLVGSRESVIAIYMGYVSSSAANDETQSKSHHIEARRAYDSLFFSPSYFKHDAFCYHSTLWYMSVRLLLTAVFNISSRRKIVRQTMNSSVASNRQPVVREADVNAEREILFFLIVFSFRGDGALDWSSEVGTRFSTWK